MQYAQNGLGWIVACLLLASCHSPKEYRTEPLKVTVETVQVSNDTGSADPAISNFNVTGYHLPTYGSATYTARCLQDGTADSQGSRRQF